jgi:ABC-type polysaccharide/polyol phosphate export permease
MLAPTLSLVALESMTTQNDLVAAAYVVVAAYFVTGGPAAELALAGIALGLAVGTKPTSFFAAPLLALLAATTSGLGLAVASLALTQRADVVVTNVVSYLTLVLCGVVAPLSSLGPVASGAAHALPLTNGLIALRACVDGRPWVGHAALEAMVGTAWAFTGIALLAVQDRRARVLGTDDAY